ncbi:hypothetical protein F2981_21655 (plasmid) [Sinorhizobium meliloti]|nr:hypothetical protein [Sinorhizobium meliloti]
MTQALHEACNVIDGLQGKLDHLVRVAMVTTSRNFGPHLPSAVRPKAPRYSDRTTIANRETVIGLLQEGNVDLALMGAAPQSIDVDAGTLCAHPYVLVGHPSIR